MNPFEMVVIIVALVTLGSVLKAGVGKKRQAHGDAAIQENAQLRTEMAQLKDRIATLERLAVDRRQRLADEIDALGDR